MFVCHHLFVGKNPNKSKDLIAHLLLQTLDPVTPDLKLLIQERLKENYQILDESSKDSIQTENAAASDSIAYQTLPSGWELGFIYLPSFFFVMFNGKCRSMFHTWMVWVIA